MRVLPASKEALWYEDGGGLRYETLPWIELKGATKHCSFCSLVHGAIVEHTDGEVPAPEARFLVTVGLRVANLHDQPFEILAFVVNDGAIVPDAYDHTICGAPGELTLYHYFLVGMYPI